MCQHPWNNRPQAVAVPGPLLGDGSSVVFSRPGWEALTELTCCIRKPQRLKPSSILPVAGMVFLG